MQLQRHESVTDVDRFTETDTDLSIDTNTDRETHTDTDTKKDKHAGKRTDEREQTRRFGARSRIPNFLNLARSKIHIIF